MIRRSSGLIVLLVASMSLVETGPALGGPVETWDATSKKYGKTTVTAPTVAGVARVTVDGRVVPVSGSRVTVAHEELTSPCHKVASVTASYVPVAGVSVVKPPPALPDACVFTAPRARPSA